MLGEASDKSGRNGHVSGGGQHREPASHGTQQLAKPAGAPGGGPHPGGSGAATAPSLRPPQRLIGARSGSGRTCGQAAAAAAPALPGPLLHGAFIPVGKRQRVSGKGRGPCDEEAGADAGQEEAAQEQPQLPPQPAIKSEQCAPAAWAPLASLQPVAAVLRAHMLRQMPELVLPQVPLPLHAEAALWNSNTLPGAGQQLQLMPSLPALGALRPLRRTNAATSGAGMGAPADEEEWLGGSSPCPGSACEDMLGRHPSLGLPGGELGRGQPGATPMSLPSLGLLPASSHGLPNDRSLAAPLSAMGLPSSMHKSGGGGGAWGSAHRRWRRSDEGAWPDALPWGEQDGGVQGPLLSPRVLRQAGLLLAALEDDDYGSRGPLGDDPGGLLAARPGAVAVKHEEAEEHQRCGPLLLGNAAWRGCALGGAGGGGDGSPWAFGSGSAALAAAAGLMGPPAPPAFGPAHASLAGAALAAAAPGLMRQCAPHGNELLSFVPLAASGPSGLPGVLPAVGAGGMLWGVPAGWPGNGGFSASRGGAGGGDGPAPFLQPVLGPDRHTRDGRAPGPQIGWPSDAHRPMRAPLRGMQLPGPAAAGAGAGAGPLAFLEGFGSSSSGRHGKPGAAWQSAPGTTGTREPAAAAGGRPAAVPRNDSLPQQQGASTYLLAPTPVAARTRRGGEPVIDGAAPSLLPSGRASAAQSPVLLGDGDALQELPLLF